MSDRVATIDDAVLVIALRRALARRDAAGWEHGAGAAAALDVLADESAVDDPDQDPGDAGPLATMAGRFGLDSVDRRLLGSVALADRGTAAHLLLGLLSGDTVPARPTVALALELAGLPADAESAHERFGAQSHLVRTGLVQPLGEDVLLARRVAVPERVAGALAGSERMSPGLERAWVEPIPVDQEHTLFVADALRAGHPLVWIHSPIGAAGLALAASACVELDTLCLTADLGRAGPAAAAADVEALLADLLLEAGLSGMVPVVLNAHLADTESLRRSVMPVIAISPQPWSADAPGPLPPTVVANRLTTADRAQLWAPFVGADVDRDIASLRLAPEQIVAVGRHARQMADLAGADGVTIERIRESIRHLGSHRSVRATGAAATLDDLALGGHARAEVERLLDWARFRDDVVALGPLHGKGGKGTGICALFTGPPGTGKTLAAHVIADTLGMDLFQVELSSTVDKYIGETEKNLERIFSDAEAMNAVLFFDEADALFGSRSDVKDSKDRYANQEVAYLLQRMEQFDGITVLASNLRGNLDPAFARRLHFIVSFPDPDEATRRELWVKHLRDLPIDPRDPVDLEALAARYELAGGDIRNVVLSAAYAAVARGGVLRQDDLVAAVAREYIKLGRRVPQ